MFRLQLLWQLYAAFAIGVVLTVTTIGYVEYDRLSAIARTGAEQTLRQAASWVRDISQPSSSDPDRYVELRSRLAANPFDVRITLLDSTGRAVLDTVVTAGPLNNVETAPLGAHPKAGYVDVRNTFYDHRSLVYTVALNSGYICAATTLDSMLSTTSDLVRRLMAMCAIGVVVTLLAGLVVARRFARHLAGITEVVSAMANGDYQPRMKRRFADDLGELGVAVKALATDLNQRVTGAVTERNKLLAILGGMIEGVIAVDADECVAHMNAAASRILSLSETECVGKPLWKMTRRRELSDTISECLSTGQVVRREATRLGSSRQQILEFHATPLRDGQGQPTGAVLVLYNVTELRRLESMRQDFVANVSHELKTPITAIRGLVETMLDDSDMPLDTRERFLSRVGIQSTRLSELVTDLLTIARLESDADDVQRTLVDLRDPITAASRALSPTADARQVLLELQLPDAPVGCLGDREALQQLASNLLSNAIKYSPAGCNVRVKLGVDERRAVLEVEDRGPGIELIHVERIFERFYRVDKARSRELGGTGLGLAIVKHVCRAHGGDVSVDSVPGRGSTFRVSIPLAPPGATSRVIGEDR